MSGMIQATSNLANSGIGGINSVYKSSKMELSRYISKNKSNIDYQNKYNVMEFGGYRALIENKGSKCQCSIKQISEQMQFMDADQKICGDYCKLLGAREQNRIVLE